MRTAEKHRRRAIDNADEIGRIELVESLINMARER